MTQFQSFLTDPANFLFGHLHETAARAGAETCDALLAHVFGVSVSENNLFWQETVGLENEDGFWPQIYLGLPAGHVVSVIYYGTPLYSVEYRYGSPAGESFLLAVESGQSLLPGLHWPEIKQIAAAVPQISSLALLALLPAVGLSPGEEPDARNKIMQALSELGYNSPAAADLAGLLASGLRTDLNWYFDEKYGWITDDQNCLRCPPRADAGLKTAQVEFFSAFKEFTECLGLNGR